MRAGQHIDAPTLQRRFKVLGLDTHPTRNTALKSLTAQIDVRSVAETLGCSAGVLAKRAEKSGNYWSSYTEAKASAGGQANQAHAASCEALPWLSRAT